MQHRPDLLKEKTAVEGIWSGTFIAHRMMMTTTTTMMMMRKMSDKKSAERISYNSKAFDDMNLQDGTTTLRKMYEGWFMEWWR